MLKFYFAGIISFRSTHLEKGRIRIREGQKHADPVPDTDPHHCYKEQIIYVF
jgi:hypothetical protein